MTISSFDIDQISEIAHYVESFSNNIQAIIIGERHCNDIDFCLQKELILSFKPEAILLEMLKTQEWNPETDELRLKYDEQDYGNSALNINDFKIYNWFKELKMKIPIVGCDLSPNQLDGDLERLRVQDISKKFIDEFEKYLRENKKEECVDISKKFVREEFKNVYKKYLRENKMGECINSSKNSKRIVAVLGDSHVRKISNMYNFVKSGYISICIDDICHECGNYIKYEHEHFDKCQNCLAIRTRTVEIIQDDV